ncbi:MAG TPA: flagellar basal body rod protein FlgB [Rhodocyclaceae bacterium]|nr:flagellar basal body rod protein FlgB [Zoogloeaceae bacterium]HRD33458.1 flagellar basal body rod protein FlgB [Rhodocyclaceae bacterium]
MKALLDDSLKFYQTALNLQAQRQEMLASNIANADTPNYKARDIDFKGALQGVLGRTDPGSQRAPLALAQTARGHLGNPDVLPFAAHIGFRRELQSSVDGNTVNMDVERAAFAENSIHYEASVTFINGLLQGMQRAIAGQ